MASQADKRKLVRLYYGTFNPDSTAYGDLIPEWTRTGIEVCLGVLAKAPGTCEVCQPLRMIYAKAEVQSAGYKCVFWIWGWVCTECL